MQRSAPPDDAKFTAADDPVTATSAERRYFVPEWGDGYFFVNERGNAAVRPVWGSDLAIDLYAVATQLRARGTHFPLLLRFQDLLQSRVHELTAAFEAAIAGSGYRGAYRGVYPVKVNQLREVVEEILDAGSEHSFGLECGSKAELMAVLPYVTDDMLLVCNGCKDVVMMRLMIEGQQMKRNIVPVVERYYEYEQYMSLLPEADVDGQFGVRVRLSTSGAGLWSESGGENSKFGLSPTELMQLVTDLELRDRPPHFRLLHFHLGSQIADIENVRQAVREAARVYAALRKRGLQIDYLDVGGGLGVSYEAGNPDVAGHINYTMGEYASSIVAELGRVCDEEGVPHPTIVSESGRAITAFHSVLLIEVIDVRGKGGVAEEDVPPEDGLLGEMNDLLRRLQIRDNWNIAKLEEAHERAESLRARAAASFRDGELTLEQKALSDRLFWTACSAISDVLERIPNDHALPQRLSTLRAQMPDHYLCNFSVFRSVVDHWAIGQRFPVMPIHRLDEEPTRRGILVDLTCDSDGEVSDFVAPRGDKRYLELHEPKPDEPYLLGFFLMGAYQDIMGDMHNLFGRVTEAHVYADPEEEDNFYIEKILDGATIEEQLALVQYFPNDLERRMNDLVLSKVRSGSLKPKEAALILEQYRQAFHEYTYLNTDPASGMKRPVRGNRIRSRATAGEP